MAFFKDSVSVKGVKFYCAEQQIFLKQCWAVPDNWHEELLQTKQGSLFYKNKQVDAKPLCDFDEGIEHMIEYCFRTTPMRVFECANKFELELEGIYLDSLDNCESWSKDQTQEWVSDNLAKIIID